MRIALKTKKSAGVPITSGVHKLLQQANIARAGLQWDVAAQFFKAALAADPGLYHIWIQYGHALKESRAYDEAEGAYLEAVKLRPESGEPHLHLGHLYKVAGGGVKAARAYYEAARVDPGNANAVSELHSQIARSQGQNKVKIIDLLKLAVGNDDEPNEDSAAKDARAALIKLSGQTPAGSAEREQISATVAMLERLGERQSGSGGQGQPALVFDASDLIGYYTHARLPTGIQRVQIEAITNALLSGDRETRICCFVDGRDDWLEVPVAHFKAITELSVRDGERNDPEWISALNRLHLSLALADPFEFPIGAYLINLGTSWWLHNYFLFVRHAKAKYGIRYIPFVHDFIPIMTPEHCVKGLTQDFISWAVGVFEHASHYLVNSEATKRDLLRVADVLGAKVRADDVAVIRLDADFRKPATQQLGKAELAKWRLDDDPFVLLVSTVESRKGHVVAMDAWLELIRRHGARKTPRLVCVGKNGWLNDAVYQRLQQSDELAKRVTMLSYLSDDELSLLYRSCSFTIYPSLYEGWGLPITESLCYGKPVIAADSSSLPEAGGEFALFVETGAPSQLADAVEKMAFDAGYRAEWEAKIAAGFRPRTWHAVAEQIDQEVIALTKRDEGIAQDKAPDAAIGAYHPITRNVETRIWPGIGSGEIFRTGLGWLWPDIWGCWTRPQGGGLAIGLPKDRGTLRVYLQLKNFPHHACPWRLRIKGLSTLEGELKEGDTKWISFLYPKMDDDDVLRMHLRGDWSETIKMMTGGTEKEYLASIGLRGFFICEERDAVARASFLEAVSLGNVLDLDAYREIVPPSVRPEDDIWDDD